VAEGEGILLKFPVIEKPGGIAGDSRLLLVVSHELCVFVRLSARFQLPAFLLWPFACNLSPVAFFPSPSSFFF